MGPIWMTFFAMTLISMSLINSLSDLALRGVACSSVQNKGARSLRSSSARLGV